MSKAGWTLAAVVALPALVGLTYCATAVNVATAPAGIINRTAHPDNVIANYEWFKQQNQDIVAMDRRIEIASGERDRFEQSAGPRAGWAFEDRQEHSRLTSILAGLRSQRSAMVATYNARAEMANRSIFRTDDLPRHIEQDGEQQ